MKAIFHSVSAWVALAYFIGAIPMGVLIAMTKGIDLRKVGSGNIGATNAVRALGGKLGLLVFALDVLKAAVPIWLAQSDWALGQHPHLEWALALIAFATIVGHIFPVYLGFRGGKGVACGLGVFVALDPAVALAGMLMYVQGIWLTRTSAVGSLTAVSAIAICVWIADKPAAYQVLAVAAAIVIWLRHIPNIKQLVTEAKQRKQAAVRAEAVRVDPSL